MSSVPKDAREIFLVAIEQFAADEWQDYLDDVCAGDPELRRRVQILLEAHDGDESLLDSPAIAPPAAMDPPLAEKVGEHIGRYRLIQQIGEGGFGIVYLAEQEKPVRRQVALKLIKPGMDTKQVIARFEAERQALALMDHPNIARVFEAGATESGRPYFIMELVRGLPITEYCDQCNLPITERLDLFVSVCQGVQHAHQKGIIHRDIKPTNVLISISDGRPTPKIIDFGVAKAISQRLTEQTLRTGFAQMLGTPLYMSPEQAEMSVLDVDTRSDIYSLGVLLYELLTGTTPFERNRLNDAGYDEIRRVLREDEPPRPSSRLSTLGQQAVTTAEHRRSDPRRLVQFIRGDLDWIVMKAIEKDRMRRYETANTLARDVHHFMKDEPVEARPPSMVYQFHKFVRRNRVAFAAGMAAVVMLIAASVGLVTSNTIIARERNKAVADKNRAERAETLADLRLDDALQANAKVTRLTKELEQRLYISDMNVAFHDWDSGNAARVVDLLTRYIPGSGDRDLRGFEWHYLWRLCQQASRVPKLTCSNSVWSIAISPNGELLATGLYEGVVVWDLKSRKRRYSLPINDKNIHVVTFSPDGRRLATTGPYDSIQLWDAATGTKSCELGGHDDWIYSITFSPDGTTLASTSP